MVWFTYQLIPTVGNLTHCDHTMLGYKLRKLFLIFVAISSVMGMKTMPQMVMLPSGTM